MAASSDLHPSVRERTEARMSATSLAEYLILRSDKQDTVLHNSRFPAPSYVSRYADAMRAIRAYCLDIHRRPEALERAKQALRVRSASAAITPRAREIAKGCAEVIDLFKLHENQLGLRAMRLVEAPRFDELVVAGTKVSIQPDLLVEAYTPKSLFDNRFSGRLAGVAGLP